MEVTYDSPNKTVYRANNRREAMRIANTAIKAYEESGVTEYRVTIENANDAYWITAKQFQF